MKKAKDSELIQLEERPESCVVKDEDFLEGKIGFNWICDRTEKGGNS